MVHSAREQLRNIKATTVPEPDASSPARAALDPHVLRNLHTFVPLTPRALRSQDATWEVLEKWLDGWEEIGMLTAEDELVTWEVSQMRTRHGWGLFS
jgi:N-alpha-acetyltransferase 35, NatC auxiliary subunit